MINFKITNLESVEREIKKYIEGIREKAKIFVEICAEHGIVVASERNDGVFRNYITFSKEVNSIEHGYESLIIARDMGEIFSFYVKKDDIYGEYIEAYPISPLLMTEFGSGPKAENPNNIPGVGRGSLDLYGHANQEGWYFKTLEGNWVYSEGYAPHMPMYGAFQQLVDEINLIIAEIFVD